MQKIVRSQALFSAVALFFALGNVLMAAVVLIYAARLKGLTGAPGPPGPAGPTGPSSNAGNGSNPYRHQATWYVDPVAGNDSATGLTPETAVKTYGQIVSRWQDTAPLLYQTTTITFLNDQPDFSDPVVFSGEINGGFFLVGQLKPVRNGTLSSVTPRNRTANQRWRVKDVTCNALCWIAYQAYVLYDSVAQSYAWVDTAGETLNSVWLTEPLTAASFFNTAPPYGPVANDDAYALLQPTRVYVTLFSPLTTNGFASEMSNVWITAPTVDSAATINAFVFLYLVRVDPYVTIAPSAGLVPTITNCYLVTGGDLGPGTSFIAGDFENNAVFGGTFEEPVVIDGDAAIDTEILVMSGFIIIGSAYTEADLYLPNLGPYGAGEIRLALSNDVYYYEPALWGGGVVDVSVGGEIDYSAGTAAAAFLKTGGLQIEGLTTANTINYTSSPANILTGITLTAAALDTPVGSGGFGGLAFGNQMAMIRAID